MKTYFSATPEETESRLFNESVAKGLEVLASFGAATPTLNLPEIAALAGISKSAAQRLTFTLEALGLLAKDEATKRYALTPKTLEIGYRFLQGNRLVERANPYLLELSRKCGETVNLTVLDGFDMVYIARYESHEHMPAYVPIGSRLPAFCTASGRAFLSAFPVDTARDLIQRAPKVKYTRDTVVDSDSLMDLIRESKSLGFSFATGEYFREDINVAACITGVGGGPLAAINISAATSRWTAARMKRTLAPLVIETARMVSA